MKNHNASRVLDPAKMTTLLRTGVFAFDPAVLGVTPEDAPTWGVVMELGYPDAVVTLVALVDGSVSIYVSDGSGVIGCGQHADVRQAAAKMLHVAAQSEHWCQPVTDYPQPGEGRVNFYLLTHQGVRGADAQRDQLDDGQLELAELYYAGHNVIGMVELLGAGVDLVDEMQLAQSQLSAMADDMAAEHHIEAQPENQLPARRARACRILPYVGTVARRSQH